MKLKDLNRLIHMLYHKEVSYTRGAEIQKKLLAHLKVQEWPCTTEDIAKGIGVSWNTAEIHLVRLQMQDKAKFRKVGRQNQWWLNKSYKENMKK